MNKIAALSLLVVLITATPASASMSDVLWAVFDLTWAVPPDLRWDDPATTVHASGQVPLVPGFGPGEWMVTGDPHVVSGSGFVKMPSAFRPEFTLALEGPWRCLSGIFDNPGCRDGGYQGSGYDQIMVIWPGTSPSNLAPGQYSTAQSGLCLYNGFGCREATLIAGSQSIISTPERAILPRLVPKFIKLGLGLEKGFIRTLQRTTTRLAAAILRAPHGDTEIFLPSVTVRVIESCAGIHTLGLLLIAAGLLVAVIGPARHPLVGLVIIVAAGLIAIEANALRVAATAVGFQLVGVMTNTAKDWIGLGTTSLALVQLVGLARILSVSRRDLPRSDRPRGCARLTA